MLIPFLTLLVFLYILIKASDYFVDRVSLLAINLNIKKSVIALLLVAVGTSFPELATSIFAILNSEPSILIGTTLGSNIANLCLVLAITAFFYTIKISKKFSLDILIMFLSALFLSLTALDSVITQTEALSLIILYIVYVIYLLQNSKAEIQTPIKSQPLLPLFLQTLFSLFVVLFSAQILVTSILLLNIPSLTISAILVALGTSLPELSVCLSAIKKKEYEIIIGNIIGSNIVVPLFIVALPTLFTPLLLSQFETQVFIPFFLISTFSAFLLLKNTLSKRKSLILLFFYLTFVLVSLLPALF